MSAASNFHIEASRVWTKGMVVQTAHLMHAISISDAHAFRPCWLVSGRLDLNCDTCLMDEPVRTGIHVIRTVASIFPYLCLERNPEAWSNIKSWPDGMTHRPDRWSFGQLGVRTGRHVVRTAGREPNFLTCKLYKIFRKHFWIAESSLKSIFTTKWFCPTECSQLQTNKLPF
jgi:hypothetical protein